MHRDHPIFVRALHSKLKLRISFVAKSDNAERVRICAPLDFGPRRRSTAKIDYYHVWDFEGASGSHPISLDPDRINWMEETEDSFDPAAIITWDISSSPWFLERDWGMFS